MSLKDTLVEIKDLSRDDILAKMRSGDLDVPREAGDREEFTKFVAMDSEQRDGYLSGIDSPDGEPKGEDEQASGGDVKDVPEPPVEQPDPPEEGSQSATEEEEEEGDDFLGYGSKEALADAHKSIMSRVGELQRQIDKINSSSGKLGRRNKDLEDEVKRLTGELDRLGKGGETDEGHSSSQTAFPEPPDPEKYDSGVFDDDYQQAMSKYQREVNAIMRKQHEELHGLRGTIEELNTGVKKASEFVETTESQTREQAWGSFWDHIHQFQAKNNLSTSIPIEEINRAVLERNRAVLDHLPKSDVEKYNKIRPLANEFADFSQGKPKLRYESVDSMVQANAERWGAFAPKPPTNGLTPEEDAALREKKRKQQEGNAEVPTSESQGSSTERIGEMPNDAAVRRLKELQTMRSRNVQGFDGNKTLYGEYMSLRKRFGVAPRA